MRQPVVRNRDCKALVVAAIWAIALFGVLPTWAATVTRTSAFDYDTSGLISKEIVEPSDSTLCLVTVYGRDAFGNKSSTTTRNCNGSAGSSPANNSEAPGPVGLPAFAARTTTASLPDPRFATTLTNALGHVETRVYAAAFGNVTSLTGPNLLTTEWAYDEFGRKTIEKRADGNGTTWSYKRCTSVTGGTEVCPTIAGVVAMYVVTSTPVAAPINIAAGTTGPQNGAYGKVYSDALNRQIRSETQGFDGPGAPPSRLIFQDTEYNALGQVSRKSRPYYSGDVTYWTGFTYDLIGRATATTTPDGGLATNGYNGLSTSVTVKALAAASAYGPATQTTSQTRNLVGQVVSVTDANNKVLTRAYDPFGNLTSTTDALGNVTSMTYDTRGRKKTMQDPDMGAWAYDYNALGELVWQRNAKNQVFAIAYDLLGRMTARVEPDLSSTWTYDKYADNSACSKGTGKLCEASTSTGYNRRHSYDAFARPVNTLSVVGGTSYSASARYDANGRVDMLTYPTGMQVLNDYSALGYLSTVRPPTGPNYWKGEAVDAEGHVTRQSLGNGVVTTNAFEATTGRLSGTSTASSGSTNNIQNMAYAYDFLGSLRSRSDAITGVSAQYDYDALNRMRLEARSGGALPSGQQTLWAYDDIGNITSRSDVGTYAYPASGANSVRPHAVSSVTGTVNGVVNPSYSYDADGNLQSGGGRSATWMSFDMPASATRGAASLTWLYDSEHQRVREIYAISGATQRVTTYLNPAAGSGLFYEEETGAVVKKKHYINAGGQTVATVTFNGTTYTRQYWHKDHLGSTAVVTNEAGAVQERLDYEPFGKRRFNNGLTDAAGTLAASATDRGYTGHEMLDEVGLIHMNGRIYDPAISRFLSADPIIQSALNLQSYNRYSYGGNNPLGGTDPSGYSWLSKTWKSVWGSTAGRILITVAVAYFTGYYTEGWLASSEAGAGWATTTTVAPGGYAASTTVLSTAGNVAVGAAGGFAGGFVGSGGHLRAGMEGAATGAAFGYAGSVGGEGSAERYAAHAVAGCGSGAMSGNGCARGAASAFAAKWATVHTADWVGPAQFAATVVVGGTTSVIGGGKFGNGAQSAAYGYLFNYCSSGKCTTAFEQAMYDWWPGYKAGTLLYNQTMGDGSWTGWEVVDAVSVGAVVAGKGLQAVQGLRAGGTTLEIGANANQVFHSFRHTDDLGLARDAVAAAIRTDMAAVSLQVGQGVTRSVTVGGIDLTYRAHRYSEAAVNIGRITGPRP